MKAIEVEEAHGELVHLLERVATGEEVLITRGGRAVARLLPALQTPDGDPLEAAAAIRTMSEGVRLGDFDIRDLIDEGRR